MSITVSFGYRRHVTYFFQLFFSQVDIITVKPKVEEMKIEVSESYSEMILTCVVNRIKPSASDLYLTIGERRYNGSVVITQNADGTLINKVVLR